MILTITLNPSIDIGYTLDQLQIDTVNRCSDVSKTAGGKGINVTRVAALAGNSVVATGFLGGTNGQFIKEELDLLNIQHNFLDIQGNTRNCIALLHEGMQTEILEAGPVLTEADSDRFIEHYRQLISDTDVITASGSLPQGIKPAIYQELITIANQEGKKFLLDASGTPLRDGIKARPYLIKPNLEELSMLTGNELKTIDDIKEAVLSITEYGIPYVVISLGEDGALGFHDSRFYIIRPPKVQAVNPVGSGDSMIAGFAAAISEGLPTEMIFAMGSAFGTLNAMENQTGFIKKDLIEEFVVKVEVQKIF